MTNAPLSDATRVLDAYETPPRLARPLRRAGRLDLTPIAELAASSGPLRRSDGVMVPARVRALTDAARLATRALLDDSTRHEEVRAIGRAAHEGVCEALCSIDLGARLRRPPLPVPSARTMASAIAASTHATLHAAFSSHPVGRRAPSLRHTTERLAEATRAYERFLACTRRATIEREPRRLLALGRSVVGFADDQLSTLCRWAGALATRPRPSTHHLLMAVDASMLARRFAMLGGASILLVQALSTPERAPHFARAVARRHRLLHGSHSLSGLRRSLRGRRVGSGVTLLGRVEAVSWLERPEKPVGVATIGRETVQLAHKSLRAHGITVGSIMLGSGKVRRDATGATLLELELDAIGPRTRAVFEDYLVDLMRPSYDLHPGSLAGRWSFAPATDRRSVMDLHARLR